MNNSKSSLMPDEENIDDEDFESKDDNISIISTSRLRPSSVP